MSTDYATHGKADKGGVWCTSSLTLTMTMTFEKNKIKITDIRSHMTLLWLSPHSDYDYRHVARFD